MTLDTVGNIYVTGNAQTASGSLDVYCTLKYSQAGILQWSRFFYGSGLGGHYAYAIASDNSSNVYVTGYAYNPGSVFDFCTVKYNSEGVQQWVNYYDGPAHTYDEADKVAVDNAGNIYVTGKSSLFGDFNFQIATLKYSPDGRQIWLQRYGEPTAEPDGLVIDQSCNIYIAGYSGDSAVALKYDSSGNLLWACNFRGVFASAYNAIAVDANDNVYVTGYTDTTSHYDMMKYVTAKYSSSGLLQWLVTYHPVDTLYTRCIGASIALDATGLVYVAGELDDMYGGRVLPKVGIVKYTQAGDTQWVRTPPYDSSLVWAAPIIQADPYNYIYVLSGLSYTHNESNKTYGVLKYDAFGNSVFDILYHDPQYTGSIPAAMAIDRNYNIVVTGSTGWLNYLNTYALTVKYSQPIGVKPISNIVPGRFNLSQNYPNPFNPSTTIKFAIPKDGNVTFEIYDVLGKLVATLANNEFKKAGEYEVSWDAGNFASGVYFYELISGEFSATKKMVLLK